MSIQENYCGRCGANKSTCALELQTPPPRDLLSDVLFRGRYPFFDLYKTPPVYGDGWSGGGELRDGKTECDVQARIMQLKLLIRWHGARNGWPEERIVAVTNANIDPMRERNDPVLGCYRN